MNLSPDLLSDLVGFEKSPLAVWLTRLEPLAFIWANKQGWELWNAPDLDSLIARDISDVSEATIEALTNAVEQMRRGEISHVAGTWTLHPRGVPTRVELITSLHSVDEHNNVYLLNQAMPVRRRLDTDLVRAGEVVRHISMPVAMLDMDGTILTRNPAAERMFGAESVIENWFANTEVLDQILKLANYDDVYSEQVDGAGPATGHTFDLGARVTRDPVAGGKMVLVHLHDETPRLNAEREAFESGQRADALSKALATVKQQRSQILVLNTQLKEAIARVEAADRAKTAFLLMMSHELRTPMNAILGFSELVLEAAEDGDTEGIVDDVAKIQHSSRRLLRTLTGVLELARLASGQPPTPSIEVLDLCDVIEDAKDAISDTIEATGAKIELEQVEGVKVCADQVMLNFCVVSVLDNAARFTRNSQVQVKFTDNKLTIIDHGPGIHEGDFPAIFEPFRQVDQSTTRAHEGSGVSLAVTRQFCELMGGALELHSEPDVGSRFSIRFQSAAV